MMDDVMDRAHDADFEGMVDAGGAVLSDPAAERQLIGLLIERPADYMTVSDAIGENDLIDPFHRQLYRAIGRTIDSDQTVTITTLIDAMGSDAKAKLYGDLTVGQYIASLLAGADASNDISDLADYLQQCSERRANNVVDDGEFEANLPFQSTMGVRLWADQNDPDGAEYEFIVEDLIPRNEGVLLIGESGTGKSFLTYHLAMCGARGVPFFGRRILRPFATIWFAHEAARGATARMRAYRKHHGLDLEPLPFAVLTDPTPLWPDPTAIDKTIREIQGIRRAYFRGYEDLCIVVDTYNAATPGASEIDSEVVSRIRGGFDRIRKETGATLIIVGHTNAAGKHRGNEQLTNNIDTVIVVTRKMRHINARETIEEKDDNGLPIRMMKVKKQREGVDGEESDFVLHVVEDGTKNKYGRMRTSCVVADPVRIDPNEADQPDVGGNRHIGAKVSKGDVQFLEVMFEALDDFGVKPPPELGLPRAIDKVVDYDFFKRLLAKKMMRDDEDTEAGRKKHAARVRQALGRHRVNLNHLKIIDYSTPWIWLTGKPVRGVQRTQPQDRTLFDPPAQGDDLADLY
jgi:hypothetical protein